MDSRKIANSLLIITLVLMALYFGKNLLIPFVLGLVAWYLLNAIRKPISRIKLGSKNIPWWLQWVIAAHIFALSVGFLGIMVVDNFEEFVEVYPKYHDNILAFTESASTDYNLPFSVDEVIHDMDVPTMMTELLNSSVNLISTISMVIIYVIFLILEQSIFPKKMRLIFKDKERMESFTETTKKIDESIHSYLSLKTFLCLISGVIAYVILISIGVDFAILWAFLIFLFNYIPIIGPFLGVLFPTLIALIQFEGYLDAVLVVSLLSTVQLIIGNIIEPKVLGDRLNLSPLTVIVALAFWGSLWGIAGMFLCVPITVILMIIFAQFPATRSAAILLSGGKKED
ncbi:MAG: AI-2E family transporter [Flavobacteriales bacterium]|nr:AI-2E family transporter [Flavobacteriales bacterium]